MHNINLIVPIAEGSERDPVSIWRPTGTQVIAAICELFQPSSVDIDDVNITVALWASIKSQLRSIRRPTATSAHLPQVCHLVDFSSIRIRNKQLSLSLAIRSERDHGSIRGPGGVDIIFGCDGMRVASIWIHDPKSIPIIGENEPLSIWGKLRRVQRTNLIRQALQPIPVDVDGVNLERPALVGGEVNHLTIRRERWIKSSRRKVCKLLSHCPVGIHNTDLIDLVDITGEHDFARRNSTVAETRDERWHFSRCNCPCQGWNKGWR